MLDSRTPARLRLFPAVSAAAVLSLIVSLLVMVAVPPAARAQEPVGVADGLTVTSTGETVLAGGQGRVTVRATNPDGVDLYNASAVVVLPVGVTYVAGSATPGAPNGIGEPTIRTWVPDPADPDAENPFTAQVLIWENVADLPLGASTSVSFAIEADDARYPVGSSFAVGSGIYATDDERDLPDVTIPPSGAPEVTGATEGGSVDATVTVIALSVSKAETGNAEAEVYRGPENPATYTVTVRTAPTAGTDDVIIEDLVPATFTVTGCNDSDYTCEIVEVDGEVFTKLTWDLGNVGAGRTILLTYNAYVALREVTLPDADEPGAPTRPMTGGYAVTNTVEASGTYTGDVVEGGVKTITTSAEATVTVLDVGIVKTVAGDRFVAGENKSFRLDVRTSEYIDATGVTVVDTIPDGMCPVLPTGVTPGGDPWPAECAEAASGSGTVTNATMDSAVYNAGTGRFTVSFTISDRPESDVISIGYDVYMRDFFHDGRRTSVGDRFSNTVELEGTVNPVAGNTVDEGAAPGRNGSESSIGTEAVTMAKTVWANPDRLPITGVAGAGTTCAAADDYTSPTGADVPALQLGDLVCFRITADFPTGVATRDVVVSDFLPLGTSMVAWSATSGAGWTSVEGLGGTPATATRWQLGEEAAGSHYVAPGDDLELFLLARVDSVPATQPRVTGNLAKMRYSGDGAIVALRDDVNLQLAPAPPLALDKKVDGVDSLSPVREDQQLTFTIDVSHEGTRDGLNDYPLDEIEVWDVLPAGFDCDDITTASPAIAPGACAPRADGRVVVRWVLDLSADPLRGGDTTRITYSLTVPSPLSISSTHTNTAAVARFTAVSTNGLDPDAGGATFYPSNPVGAFPEETKNAAQASDSATVGLAGATVEKTVTATGVTEPGNSALGQATIGETVTWEYTATIPAKTSVFNGILNDQLPTATRWDAVGVPELTAAPAGVVADPGCARDADEFRLCTDPSNAAFGDLFFPTTWTNAGTDAAEFTVSLTVQVADDAANTHGAGFSNAVELRSTPTTTDSGSVLRDSDSAGVTVVVPSPALAKEISLTSATGPWAATDASADGGQTVYYRLTATNAGGRPPLHDTVIVDCLASGMTDFTNLTAASVATVSAGVAGDGSNGCAVGRTKYTWTLTNDLATTAQIVYSARVPDPIASSSTFRNDATLTGSTLAGAVDGERTLTAAANRIVTAAIPTITKAKVPAGGTVVPGETVSWRVTVTVPTGVSLYQARILDTLPAQLGTAANATFSVSCGSGWTEPCPTATRLAAPGGNAQVLGVYLDDIAAAETTRTIFLDVSSTVLTSVSAAATVTNTARITWDTAEATPPATAVAGTATSANATATAQIRHPLVTATKTVSPTTPIAQGQIFSYTATATASSNAANNNKTAYNVVFVDTVPTGVIPVVSSTDGTPVADGATVAGGVWNQTARTITWTISSLAVGSPQSFTYPAKLALASTLSGTALTNSVRAQSWTSLPADGRSYGPGTAATASVTPAFPLVNTAKSQLTSNPVYIGDQVTFQVTVSNAGTATAVSMDAVDTLPTGWTYVAGSTVIDGSAATDPSVSGQTLTWSGLGQLTTGQSHTITYRAVATSSVSVGSGVEHRNTARAAAVTDGTGGTSYNGGTGSYLGTTGEAVARIHRADLSVVKTAGTFVAGQNGTFDIVVSNAAGSDPAVGVTVTDTLTLPDGVTFVSAAGTGWSCSVPTGTGEFSCQRSTSTETLAAGASWPAIRITVAVAADVVSGTSVPNTARVAARTEDRNSDNNTSSATGEVITRADLAVSKAVAAPSTGPVTAGEAIEWSVTVRNNGPSVSRGSAGAPIVLTDTLPSGVSDVAFVGTAPAGCAISGASLRCEIASDIAVDGTVTVRFRGVVDSDVTAGSVIENTASVTPVTTDPQAGNNSSTVRTNVRVEEDLTIVKSVIDPAPPAAVVPGESISYRIAIGNRGPSDSRGVFVVDTLPSSTTFDAITAGASAWSADVDGNTVTFTLDGDLAAGTSAPVLEYRVRLDPAFSGTSADLLNTAAVSSTWYEAEDLPRPTDTAQPGPAQPSADLELTKTVRPSGGAAGDPVIAGETAVYTLTTDNLGPSNAGAVTLTDTLPTGLSFVTPLPAGCVADGRDLTCVKPAGLTVSETPWSVSVTVRVDAAFVGATLVNAAEATSTTADPRPSNNIDSVELDVIQRAQLTITKRASDDVVRAGEDVTWTIVVGNDGPSDAQNVTLSDLLDARLQLVDVESDDAVTCTGTASLSCTIGTLAAGASTQITVTTTVRSSVVDGASIENSATASSTTIDAVTGEPSTATDDDAIEVTALSELSIEKTTTTPVVTAGGNAVFRLQVGNDGPSDAAASVVVTDVLPEGLTFVSASTVGGPAIWECDGSGADVTCELQDAAGDAVTLAAGGDAPVLQIVAAVDASLPAGTVTNTATVTSPSEPTPPSDSVDVDVRTAADLGITKVNVGTPTAGQRFAWTITVTNHGPSDSVATADDPIVVTDTLPDGVSFVSATGTGAVCDADGADVVCEIASTLEPTDTVTITLTVDVAEDVSGTLTNTATVAPGLTDEPETSVWPNEATATTPTVIEEADLAIEKVALTDDADIVAGEPIRWQLTVTNLGPSNSDGSAEAPIVVTDTLPAGVTADAVTAPSSDWSCTIADDASSLTCELAADLATDDPQVFEVVATVGTDVQGTITNVATVAPGLTPQPADHEGNDTDAVSSVVGESADLRLLKDVLSPIVAGSTGTYLLQVYNDGPSTAREVTVVDTLPEVLTFERVVTPAGETSPWTCAADPGAPTEVTCTFDGVIEPGVDPIELVLEVSAASDLGGSVTNRAVVSSITPDPVPENNSDSVIGVLQTTADLVLGKTHDADALAVAGREFTWTLTVTNDGPSDSVASPEQPIVVTDTLPVGVSFVADGSDAACAAADGDARQVVCEITSTIAAGDAVSIDLRVALDSDLEGSVTNTATVVPGATADPNTANNGADDTVTITEVADLLVVKDVVTAAEEIVAGRQIVWTVQVTNDGPSNSDATADDPITVVDTLPAGVTFVSASGDDWSCEAGEPAGERQTLVCERAEDLPVGEAPVITVTGLIGPDVRGTVRNDVEVTPGLTPDEDADDNSDHTISQVGESADLALSKAVTGTITAGGAGEYTLVVTNLGPSSARGVTVTDTLPNGLTFRSAAGTGWECEPAEGSDVVCTYDGVLAPAASVSFVLTVDAAEQLQGDIVNTAVVSTTTPDPNPDNDTATATGLIAEIVDLSIVKTAVGEVEIGEEFAYELSVRNAGPSQARGVRVEDLVPNALEVLGISGSGWDCAVDDSTGQTVCLRDTLNAGATAPTITVRVRVLPAAYPEVSNTATVASTSPEDAATTADNTSTATVTVPPKSDLVITKTRLDELVTGKQARYDVTVVNNGPTEDPGPITVTDDLPEGLTARSWTIDGAKGSCEQSAEAFTCTVDGLAVGQSVTFIFTVDVAATAVGDIVNTATVGSVAGRTTSQDTADGVVTVVDLPSTGGTLAPYLPFGVALLLLGVAAVWWSRRQKRGMV
jgi:uncharacterized repeat protein (TIGR01451 family)/fimbrial isopeptide formation D2 family protein